MRGIGVVAVLAGVASLAVSAPAFTATAPVQPDAIITGWHIYPNGAGWFTAQDTHDSGRGTITALFSPAAVKGVLNLTQPDNVQALVAAMQAKDWGAAAFENLEFSPTLAAKIEAAGVNVGWVYQRLYSNLGVNAPKVMPTWVPTAPQAVYLNGQGPVAQVPKPAAAQPTPVVVQHPIMGTQTETVPSAAKATNPVASITTPAKPAVQPTSKAAPKPATPAQQIAQAKAQEAQNAVVAVEPSPKAPAVLVPGAHIAPGWRTAQKTIEQVRAAQQRAQREDLAGTVLAVLVGLFFLVQRLRRAWPFRRRVDVW